MLHKKNKKYKYIIVIQRCMNDDSNMRLVFRPTTEQYNKLQTVMESGKYKHLSELLRHLINIGLEKLERKK